MTAQIANTINDVLEPQGVGVIIKASPSLHDDARRAQAGHRSRDQPHAGMLRDNALTRQEFLGMAT
jgi:GTP cyclohydrolase I